jgi:hypothetical protein
MLSFLRDSRLDENIYIGDSVEITNILQRGEWIGDYGIGLHGFLNKFLIGIIFVFTGPSVFVATLSNILFAIFSGILFYKMLIKYFKLSKVYSLLGVTLLFCSYQFFIYTPTFYRDIPALFFVLLVIYSILGKKSKWLIGLFLLLLLDSKEHVFYTMAPAFVVWIAINSLPLYKKNWIKALKIFVVDNIKLFLPSLIFLILMFTTSLIPLNIYNANILGLVEGGLESMTSNFDLEVATYNRDVASNVDVAKVMPIFSIPEGASALTNILFTFINVIFLYLGKIFYPRTFSFLSVPFIILVPSLCFAYRYFVNSYKEKEIEKLILPILLFFYISIYILHASISRYILPISPIIFLFFLLFFKDFSLEQKDAKKVLILTLIFALGGLYFEYSYIPIKIFINFLLFSIYLYTYFGWKKNLLYLKYLFILIVSAFSVGTCILASYSYGQIKGYRLYGYNRECEKIVSLTNKGEKIWINDIYWDRLPFILREENLGNPEWRWNLEEWLPKKEFLLKNNNLKTYNFYWNDINSFKEDIEVNGIQKVVYVELKVLNEKENIQLQDHKEILLDAQWLSLQDEIKMKNKIVYIFNVTENSND